MIDNNAKKKRGLFLAVKILAGFLAVVLLYYLLPMLAKFRFRLHRHANMSGIKKAMLIYGGNTEQNISQMEIEGGLQQIESSELQIIESDNRMPASNAELKYWLENMVWYHHFSDDEISRTMGLPVKEVENAKRRFNIQPDNRPELKNNMLLVLPYPGGRHPRIGFLDGAINPQRETKFSVFTPWDSNDYAVVDVPEAIWSNLGLTYLAHTHIETIWTTQKIELEQLEWNRGPNGSLDIERNLPNGIVFGVKVTPARNAVLMKHWLKNGTPQRLTDLRVQICVMTKMVKGFELQTNENKVFKNPYTACRSPDGKRWIITAWTNCERTWGNKDCPCLHSDPKFPDTEPGQTHTIYGWFSFYQGTDIEAELERIESTGWQKIKYPDETISLSTEN